MHIKPTPSHILSLIYLDRAFVIVIKYNVCIGTFSGWFRQVVLLVFNSWRDASHSRINYFSRVNCICATGFTIIAKYKKNNFATLAAHACFVINCRCLGSSQVQCVIIFCLEITLMLKGEFFFSLFF